MIINTLWKNFNSAKIDITLKNQITECYKRITRYPRFFKKLAGVLIYHLKKFDVIVEYNNNCCLSDKAIIKDLINLKNKKKSEKRVLELINGYSSRLPLKKIDELLELSILKSIHSDFEVKAMMDKVVSSMEAAFAWETNLRGKGVTTAVLDTGIFPHKDLVIPENRIIAFKDFIKNKSKPYDDNGHGTHLAGTIAGNGQVSKGKYKGIAYESNLVGVKVLNRHGYGKISNVINGIDWCIKNREKYNIKTICLAIGTDNITPDLDGFLHTAFNKAWDSGINICAAAGNSGANAGTISVPGTDPTLITVGTVSNDMDKIQIAGFSSRGPTIKNDLKPDAFCLGTNIISLRSPGNHLGKQTKINKYYMGLSGTSVSTSVCCGVIAVLLDANPMLKPDQIKNILIELCNSKGSDINAVNLKEVLSYLIQDDIKEIN